MRDFVSFTLRSRLSQYEVRERLIASLPDFSFRMGDSDANGLYVSGVNEDQAQVKVWLGEAALQGQRPSRAAPWAQA